ncbi:MAG: hypothetical protein KDB22_27195, partial [Planctomycetales bacterium]|nr:hypothetical protein [Planctomycetales bacterium]
IGFAQYVGTKNFDEEKIHTFKLLDREGQIEQLAIEIKQAEDARQQAEQERLAKEFPTWHSKSGHQIQAKFIRYAASRVLLETIDQKKIWVNLSDFTDQDAARLRGLIKAARNPESVIVNPDAM